MRISRYLPWLAGLLVLWAAVLFGMFTMRDNTLATMNTPQAHADWQAWRQSEPNQRKDLPVQRRPPKSTEPPALVLMRDHFPVLLTAALVFSMLLYVALAFTLRGVLARHGAQPSEQEPQK